MSQIANCIVNGGNPASQPEFENWTKWNTIFRLYEVARNPRYGHLEHLPASGGLLDQPCKTLEALMIVSFAYQNKLAKDMEQKTKGFRRR